MPCGVARILTLAGLAGLISLKCLSRLRVLMLGSCGLVFWNFRRPAWYGMVSDRAGWQLPPQLSARPLMQVPRACTASRPKERTGRLMASQHCRRGHPGLHGPSWAPQPLCLAAWGNQLCATARVQGGMRHRAHYQFSAVSSHHYRPRSCKQSLYCIVEIRTMRSLASRPTRRSSHELTATRCPK